MKNNITELVFILDRSGSMQGLEGDTIGGFNALIEKQKEVEGKCYVSTILFDNLIETLHDRVELADIRPMTDKDYTVRGATALLDALGSTIRHIGSIHKYARPEDVPEHTLFVVTTDGMENASHNFTAEQVKEMVEDQKKKHGWEFLFLGANIDAVQTARRFGIGPDRAVNYRPDGKGTAVVYETVAETACAMRCAAPISQNWSRKIKEDYEGRK